MDDFCKSKFWDLNVTWYTDTPSFTACFQNTALVWAPCIFLLTFAIFDAAGGFNSNAKNIPWSALNIFKIAFTCVLILLQVSEFFIYSSLKFVYNEAIPPAEFYSPFAKLLSFIVALSLDLFNKKYGKRSSGVLFAFWILTLLCNVPSFIDATNYSEDQVKHVILSLYVLEMLYFPMVLGMLLLHCWADLPPMYEKVVIELGAKSCPESGASVLNHLFFFWVEELARKGYRKALEFSDLWNINPDLSTKTLNPKFTKLWDAAVEKHKLRTSAPPVLKFIKDHERIKPTSAQTPQLISVVPIFLRMFWPQVVVLVILKCVHSAFMISPPLILNVLLAFIEAEEESWKGYLYALVLFLTAIAASLVIGQCSYRNWMIALRLKSIVVSAIYAKALRISNSARDESSVGEIVNLMSVDAQKLVDICMYINILWSAPLEICISLYILWGILGPSVIAGFGVMILLVPINGFITTKARKLQVEQMKNKDKRIKLMNEIVSGIKVVKLYAWEPPFQKRVTDIRNREIDVAKKSAYLFAVMMCILNSASFLVAVASFASFILIGGGTLTPQVAFVSLSLFNNMRMPLNNFPMVISFLIQAMVSLKRINKFMNAEEINFDAVSHDENEESPITIQNGTFTWNSRSELPILRNINLTMKEGSLIAVVGPVGSGKSSLLSAILGDIEKVSGKVNTKGSCAYVTQQAWIQNASVRDNILFGLPFEDSRYNKVVEACALKPDLEILPAGDKTEIGERGINLSGGQKQRVSLARATYNNADFFLLDDPLSSVDSHVGKHLFKKVIGPEGLLKHKTRVLVTHSITFLNEVDHIIVLKDGEISESGTYKDLLRKKGDFSDFLIQYISSDSIEDTDKISAIAEDLENTLGTSVVFQRQTSQASETGSDTTKKRLISRQLSRLSNESSIENTSSNRKKQNLTSYSLKSYARVSENKDKLIEAEAMEMGNVKLGVFFYYMKCVGLATTSTVLIFYIAYQGFLVGANGWLAAWSNGQRSTDGSDNHDTQVMYLVVYTTLGIGQVICVMIASLVLAKGTLNAAARLHWNILEHILKAPMSFFDTTPLGRIINRFTKDIDTVDTGFTMTLGDWLSCLLVVISTLGVITYTTSIFAVAVIPIIGFYMFTQRFYAASFRQLRRLDSVTKSPIYSHFSETLCGNSIIRAFRMQDRFINSSELKVDKNICCKYPAMVVNRFLGVSMEVVGNLIVLFAAVLAVSQADVINAGLAGLSISYALQITFALNWLLRMTNDVETNLVSVERLKEYGEIDQEADWCNASANVPKTWPNCGELVFERYATRYREGLSLVLKDISCKIKPCEKIGIVGRTGAGKSSLTLGLFRIVEPVTGRIVIDKLDISKLGLHDLRQKLTVIPQDPVIFSGSLRMNLDPLDNCSDDQIWKALELAHLKHYVKGLDKSLEHQLTEGGENLSVGQRQLVCLTRALLRKTKILILDEATAAVDLETDALIQETIRTEFKDCTIITIAHRINTIMDYTRIMVLDNGTIAEFDTPANLLQNSNSIFFNMAKDAGIIL